MDISVNKAKELEFLIYEFTHETKLTLEDIENIIQMGKHFLIEVLNNEDEYNKWSTSP